MMASSICTASATVSLPRSRLVALFDNCRPCATMICALAANRMRSHLALQPPVDPSVSQQAILGVEFLESWINNVDAQQARCSEMPPSSMLVLHHVKEEEENERQEAGHIVTGQRIRDPVRALPRPTISLSWA